MWWDSRFSGGTHLRRGVQNFSVGEFVKILFNGAIPPVMFRGNSEYPTFMNERQKKMVYSGFLILNLACLKCCELSTIFKHLYQDFLCRIRIGDVGLHLDC